MRSNFKIMAITNELASSVFYASSQRSRDSSALEPDGVPYCHQLHYLQMTSEKLAKAYACDPQSVEPPPMTHAAFVRFLQTIKGRHDIRRKLGYGSATVFVRFIDSLLPLAYQIQQLAPAGLTQPNPEYPWRVQATNAIQSPVKYDFPEFDPRAPQMMKLDKLLTKLMRLSV